MGGGNDTLYGSGGNDSIEGGDGDDYIYAYQGINTIHGGAGNDSLWGANDGDLLTGGDGNDLLAGFAGDDTLLGGAGDDTLYSETGDEYLGGGDDADTFVVGTETGTDTIVGGEGGNDDDVIDLSGLSGPATITYNDTGAESGTITDGTNTITFSEIERLILTDQNDSVDGSETYAGFAGDAPGINVDARGGDDTVIGGRGGDTIDGGESHNQIHGGYGDDHLQGRAGDDTLRGDEGNDTIFGEGGADSIDGGLEDDTLYGGEGNDTIDGGEGNDALVGDAGADSISGGQGEDFIDGGLGDDTLEGGSDDDFIVGGGGNDSLDGGEGWDELYGGVGNDTVSGGTGNDALEGQAGNDVLAGGLGDDTLDGGSGDDSLTGGDGNDIFEMSDGNDTIADFNFGNCGTLNDGDSTNNDFINLSGYYDHITELYADHADDGVLNQSNTTDTRGRSTDYSDNDQYGSRSMRMQGASADNSSFTRENTDVVCFTSGTAIRTPSGDMLIDDLTVGDLVCTMDNAPQPIRWIGKRTLNRAELANQPNLRPILIKRGVLGVERDLLVSPQHGMLIGRGTQLARAKHLVEKTKGVRIANGKKVVTYIHLMFDAHQIIFAESSPSESFYPGPMGLKMMDTNARNEIFALFPDLATGLTKDAVSSIYGQTARHFLRNRDIKGCIGLQDRPLNLRQVG